MIAWLLLLALFSKSSQDTPQNGALDCGPHNLNLTNHNQTLVLTWEDDPSCSAIQDGLVYELKVLIADKPVHDDEVVVTPAQIGSTHSWKWTSHLALECASHSVRLRSRYNSHSSPWKQEQTPPVKQHISGSVYPKDKMFEVGSIATFCCVVPPGEHFSRMHLPIYEATTTITTKISENVYALTVNLTYEDFLPDVQCEIENTTKGASFHVGYPPRERDLRCETRDLKSVECLWTKPTEKKNPPKFSRTYYLQGRQCANVIHEHCKQELPVDGGKRNWTLTVNNPLGKLELRDTADLTKRVRMYAPVKVKASVVNPRSITLTWRWSVPKYSELNIKCQVHVSHKENNYTRENLGVGLNSIVLKDLIPNWPYKVKVRCGTVQPFWSWGDWSQTFTTRTKGDVPEALDVWMQMKEDQTVIVWKELLAKQHHGKILDYEVAWVKTKERNPQNITMIVGNCSVVLKLDTSEEHTVNVTARNRYGRSPPSTITVPSHNPDKTRVKMSSISGSNGGFILSWSASPDAICGYIVDWCPAFGTCTVDWLIVPPNRTNASIFSNNFEDGVRYVISIFACTLGAPVLLQQMEGYMRETGIKDKRFNLNYSQRNWDVQVFWDPIPLREQSANIQGYILYCEDDRSKTVSVTTGDPKATSLTAKNLNAGTYTFTVVARTAVGLGGNSSIIVTLNPSTDNFIIIIFVSLGTFFIVLSFVTFLCYRHWGSIKKKVYPPIPKPVLTDKWLTSPDEHVCHHHLYCERTYYGEAQTVIPTLLHKFGVPAIDCSHDYVPFTFSRTPKGYSNKPLKTRPSVLTLPSIALPSQPGLPSSSFRGVFPNPSYNLIMQAEEQQSRPESQEGMPKTKSFCGYQPQSPEETFTVMQPEEKPDSTIHCVSTYILVPRNRCT